MNNPMQLLQAMRNPQQFIQNAMKNSQIMQNPIAKNAIEMYQKGDSKGINDLMNNLCRERGITPEEAQSKIKSMLGM